MVDSSLCPSRISLLSLPAAADRRLTRLQIRGSPPSRDCALWSSTHITSPHLPCAVPPTSLLAAPHPPLPSGEGTGAPWKEEVRLQAPKLFPRKIIEGDGSHRPWWVKQVVFTCFFQQKYGESRPFSHAQNFWILPNPTATCKGSLFSELVF